MAERLQIMKCDDKEEKVMFHEEYTALCNAGVAKNNLLKKNPLGYFISYENLFSTWLEMKNDFNVSNVRDALSAFERNIDDVTESYCIE